MIRALIHWSLSNRFLVLCALLALGGFGWRAVVTTPVDAIPDLSENQVIVFADWPGRGPREVEDQVTYPLSVSFQGLAGVKTVRAISMFGFSLLTIIFDDTLDNYIARTRVLERLSSIGALLPPGVVPRLGPDATGLGWIYQYYLEVDPAKAPSGGYDLGHLRAVQDFFLRYQIASVPGVAEVAGIGGFVRQYQIEVSSAKMRAAGVSLGEVMDAAGAANLNVGGRVIEENGMEFVVRGLGLVESAADLETAVVRAPQGMAPIRIQDIAEVRVGGAFRRGALDVDGREVVGGIVVMRTGENARRTIEAVKKRLKEIAPSLPPGVEVRPFYDRSDLIDRTIATLKDALLEEIILVTLVHILFLAHFRSILIVTIPLPASILVSFLLMRQFGISSNIMSLSGIAIAIGVLVDAGIVITENVMRRCGRLEAETGRPLTSRETWETSLEGSAEVGRPVLFAMGIILLAFLPVFALGGQEGKLFHPLAFTKTFAMVGATLLAVTVVPVLCSLLVRGPFHDEEHNRLMRPARRLYGLILDAAMARPAQVLLASAAVLAVSAWLVLGTPRALRAPLESRLPWAASLLPRGVGGEFMPPLHEGSLLFMPVLVPSTSLTEVQRVMAWQDRVIRTVPEVEMAAGKLGRADTATDPAPVEMIETTITLKPPGQWRPGMTQEKIVAELTEKLSAVPGYVPGFLQPIENRILMLSTGIRAQVGVKILGGDLDTLQRTAYEVERVVRQIPGAIGVAPSRVQAKPYLEIRPDRFAIAQFGLTMAGVLRHIEAGVGGVEVGTAIEGRVRYPIQVRLAGDERNDIETIRNLLVATPTGARVPLGQIAGIRRAVGPSEIASENGQLRLFVQANVAGRDLGGFMEELQRRLRDSLTLPEGVTLQFSGQFEHQLRAQRTLAVVVPATIGIIFLLLFLAFRSALEAAHVLLAVPFALSGGFLLQWALGYPFSVAVWVGYIALFGTAIQTGVVMVTYIEQAVAESRARLGARFGRADLVQAIRAGAMLRLRPKLMTVITTVASLLPILLSAKAGAEVMKPLAAPVVGGMASSLLHILIVTPVLYLAIHSRKPRA